jgi:hypothetical protein
MPGKPNARPCAPVRAGRRLWVLRAVSYVDPQQVWLVALPVAP